VLAFARTAPQVKRVFHGQTDRRSDDLGQGAPPREVCGRHGPCIPMAKGRAALSHLPDPRPRPTAVKPRARRPRASESGSAGSPSLHTTAAVQGVRFLSRAFTELRRAVVTPSIEPGLPRPARAWCVSSLAPTPPTANNPAVPWNNQLQLTALSAPPGQPWRRRFVLANARTAPQLNWVFS